MLLIYGGDPAAAETALLEAIQIFRSMGTEKLWLAHAYNDIGLAMINAGRFEEAQTWLELSLAETPEEEGRLLTIANSNLARVEIRLGNLDRAEQLLDHAFALVKPHDLRWRFFMAGPAIEIALRREQLDAAAGYLRVAVQLAAELDTVQNWIWTMPLIIRLATARNDWECVARAAGGLHRLRTVHGLRPSPPSSDVLAARRQLGEQHYEMLSLQGASADTKELCLQLLARLRRRNGNARRPCDARSARARRSRRPTPRRREGAGARARLGRHGRHCVVHRLRRRRPARRRFDQAGIAAVGPRHGQRQVTRARRFRARLRSAAGSHLALLAARRLGPAAHPAVPALAAIVANARAQWSYRAAAADVLGAVGPKAEPVLPAMVKALADPYPNVRGYVAGAIGKIGPAAIPHLLETMRTGEPDARLAAGWALAAMGTAAKPALPELEELSRSDDQALAAAASQAIEAINAAPAPPADAPDPRQ